MYFFYVDESGNRDIDHEQFYVLATVGMWEGHWKKFHHHLNSSVKIGLMETIRQRSGITLDLMNCEVKSNWIRNVERLKEKEEYKFLKLLTKEEIKNLVEEYFSQIEEQKMVVIAVVIDKKALRDPIDNAIKLHNKAWELLCEKIENFMEENHPKHNAIVIADDIGLQHNKALAGKHSSLYRRNTSSGLRLKHIIEMPFFVRSEVSEGVQLADLCAYNILRAFRDDNPDYPFFARLLPYIYRSGYTPVNRIDGLRVFPDNRNTSKMKRLI